MPSRRVNKRRNGDHLIPLIPEDPLNEKLSHAKFRNAFTVLAESMAAKNNLQAIAPANLIVNTVAYRIRDFTWMNPPVFFGSKSEEDPHEFLDYAQKDNLARTPGSKSQGSVNSSRTNPVCKRYGKNHKGECMANNNVCFRLPDLVGYPPPVPPVGNVRIDSMPSRLDKIRKVLMMWLLANVMDDALSRLSMESLAYVEYDKKELVHEIHQLARLGVCYHSSIQMALFESLYGRRYRSPIGWFEVDETTLIRTALKRGSTTAAPRFHLHQQWRGEMEVKLIYCSDDCQFDKMGLSGVVKDRSKDATLRRLEKIQARLMRAAKDDDIEAIRKLLKEVQGTAVNIIVGSHVWVEDPDVGSHVWVEDPDVAWIDGETKKITNGEADIERTDGKKVPLMEESITIGVDCHGEWTEKSNQYVWHWKEGEMLEAIAMTVQSDILYDDFVKLIIRYCGLNCQPKELVISYMHSSFENQRVLPFKTTDQVRLRAYLSDSARPVLRVYMVERLRENEK
ncbi:hypothetical protein FXO37_14486 [Capsicum annuum]|nr:hypothetical protein FXO37_14486 [Capsicum annuum]